MHLHRRVGRHAARRSRGRCRRATHVLAFSHTGYTTNLPLADVTGGKAWVAWEDDGEPLAVEHGGPARLLVPHLYFWKSAKWVAGLRSSTTTSPGSGSATATTTAATRGSSSATRVTDDRPTRRPAARRRGSTATVVAIRDETPTREDVPARAARAVAAPAPASTTSCGSPRPTATRASRSYSVASAPDDTAEIELTVERLDGRRGVDVPARRRRRRRRARGARADRRLVRLGRRHARRCSSAAARASCR